MSNRHRSSKHILNDNELDALWSADNDNTSNDNTNNVTVSPDLYTTPAQLHISTSYSTDSITPSSVLSPANNVLNTVLNPEQQAKRARREALIKQKLQERKLANQQTSSNDTLSSDATVSAIVTPLHSVFTPVNNIASNNASLHTNTQTDHTPSNHTPSQTSTTHINNTHNDIYTPKNTVQPNKLLSPIKSPIRSPPLISRSDSNIQRIGTHHTTHHNGYRKRSRSRSRSRERHRSYERTHRSPIRDTTTFIHKYAPGDVRAPHSVRILEKPIHFHPSPSKPVIKPTISLIRRSRSPVRDIRKLHTAPNRPHDYDRHRSGDRSRDRDTNRSRDNDRGRKSDISARDIRYNR